MEGMKCSASNRLSVNFLTFAASISPWLTLRNKRWPWISRSQNRTALLTPQSFFDREWSTYGPLDSHNPMNCATGLILLLWHYKEFQTHNNCTFVAKKAIYKPKELFSWFDACKIKNLIEGRSYCLHVCLLRTIFSHTVFYLLYWC